MTIIQAYAPTDDAEDKEAFYHQLQAILQKIKKRDIKIVIGDFNAKVGTENTGKEDVIGKEGTGTSNENGERLIEMCQANGFSIGGTWFPHKDLVTWISPNGLTENQINHFLVSKRWRSSLQDVWARRSADIGPPPRSWSDEAKTS